jgi:hypothetical protein
MPSRAAAHFLKKHTSGPSWKPSNRENFRRVCVQGGVCAATHAEGGVPGRRRATSSAPSLLLPSQLLFDALQLIQHDSLAFNPSDRSVSSNVVITFGDARPAILCREGVSRAALVDGRSAKPSAERGVRTHPPLICISGELG